MKKLIEAAFPLQEVNVLSMYEMSMRNMVPPNIRDEIKKIFNNENVKMVNSPRLQSLHYYPARIPTWGARAVTLASILSEGVDLDAFLRALGYEELKEVVNSSGRLTIPFTVNPDKRAVGELLGRPPEDIVVVDPMAGGGSIPLESLRLGFTTIAGDINPVSYLLLRATVEFPAKYGRKLFELVLNEAKALIEYARKTLGGYYSQDEKQSIYVLGVRHKCGGVVPIYSKSALSKEDGLYFTFEARNGELRSRMTKSAQPPLYKCPHCNMPISASSLRAEWVKKHKEALDKLLEGVDYSSLVEELYVPVAIVTKQGYREPLDSEKLAQVNAYRELLRLAREDSEFFSVLPISEIPKDNEVFADIRREGLTHWHHLFTPRQLLALYMLVKYVRERARELYVKYGELGAAVVLYLALALTKKFNYNNLLTQWDASMGSTRDFIGSQYALSRSASLGYDFIDSASSSFGLPWALEIDIAESGKLYNTAGGILPVVRILCEKLEGLWKESRDAIYLWDATKLSSNLPDIKADLIHVDPPYYDQHNYAGVMEFFWQILQRALLPVLDILFPPERVKIEWSPYQAELPRQEIRGPPPRQVGRGSEFGDKIEEFLRESLKVLKPDGLLVMWYTYSRIEGWEELFYRFYNAGFQVEKCWQVWSQSPQRRVALQASAFFTSMVIAARPAASRTLIGDPDDPRLYQSVSGSVRSALSNIYGRYGLELLKEATVTAFADAISAITKFEVIGPSDPVTRFNNFTKMRDRALRIAIDVYLGELARLLNIKRLRIGAVDDISKLYLLLILISDVELRAPYDFSNKLSQILRVELKYVAEKSGSDKWRLISPAEAPKRLPRTTLSSAINLIKELGKAIDEFGERAAEESVKKIEESAVAYAYYLTSLCGDKLVKSGIVNNDVLQRINTVLGGSA